MSTLITINVTNNSNAQQNFFFFQQPAAYAGGAQVYTNSLMSTALPPFSTSGSVFTFLVEVEYFAGVQQCYQPPQVGAPSGYTSAIQAIDLTSASGANTNNCTTMSASPLALTPPTFQSGVQKGAFRIISPAFEPTLQQFNGGSAVRTVNGGVVLSNFITVSPNSNLDCQPILKFYVATGTYTAGTVMNFTSSSATAALCDATAGFNTFNVVYNSNGTWGVTPSANISQMAMSESGLLSIQSVEAEEVGA